ncbi:uncharacterized protein LOC126890751 [Diabrotica virgifera virgifera]|uniref:Uncharacterized protein n=1 Tax=Diabrotica virgifera virgifera TaxID=50390 RepID=A0ABM5L0B5_DIAVI|nr:uncharacterized protein LOC126890751 [Diabrotica virgifera virgifera]
MDMDPLDLASDGVTETSQHNPQHSEDHVRVVVLSTVIPVCVLILMMIVLRKIIIRRRTRCRNGHKSTIYTIPEPVFQPRGNDLKSMPDIERVVNKKNRSFPKSILKENSKQHGRRKNDKTKEFKLGKGRYWTEPVIFPREPVYQAQQKPSYLVPFTALPKNFDFSLPNVEVHSDFVIIKDLDILQTYWYETENNKEEYKKQPQLNPNFT